MICESCREAKHETCLDNDPETGEQKTDYRGCTCHHRVTEVVDDAKAGESFDG